jgi:hypothetical protein
MAPPTVELFVVGHADATLSTVPQAPGITVVDLRTLTLDPSFDDRFAESSFLLSPEARATTADVVGLCSANYDRKWPEPPHLVDLPRLARRLAPGQALGEELAPLDAWMASAEHNHPGLAAILRRLAGTFDLDLHQTRVPGANTFLCSREEWFHLLDVFGTLLGAALDWYGFDQPFRYRCPDCESVSDTGYGRWTATRHVAYLGERITRLIFASRPGVEFSTPPEFERASQLRFVEGRLRRMARGIVSGRAGSDDVDAHSWHRSTSGLGATQAAEFVACPVCTADARPAGAI